MAQLDWVERTSTWKMIHTTSWDQSFVDGVDEVAGATFNRLRYRSPSESDSALTTIVSRSETAADSATSRVSGRRHSGRRRTLNGTTSRSSSTADDPGGGRCLIDACCTVVPTNCVSRTDLTWTLSPLGDEQSDNIRTTDHLERSPLLLKCDDDRLYQNTSASSAVSDDLLALDDCISSRSNLPEVTSSAAASQVPTMRLLLPGDEGVARKASSSSTSSVCDSMLELCTASSRCSSCSEAITTTVLATPLGDTSSLPDSGNGSSDIGLEHFRFPRLVSPDPGISSDRLRGTTGTSYCVVANFLPEWDAERLEAVYWRLSQCGFYYGRLTLEAAAERLRQAPVGTFLLRDSTSPSYLFSISVQTCRGTTSIRMVYHAGLFHLDCSAEQEHLMPTFDCALRLVAHYVRICSERRRHGSSYVFLESSGRRDTPVVLRRPLYRQVDRLTHLCRRAVHLTLSRGPWRSQPDRGCLVDRLQLIPSLKTYLKDYPYELWVYVWL